MSLWEPRAEQENAREKFASVSPSQRAFPEEAMSLWGLRAGQENAREKFASVSPSQRAFPEETMSLPAPPPGPTPNPEQVKFEPLPPSAQWMGRPARPFNVGWRFRAAQRARDRNSEGE